MAWEKQGYMPVPVNYKPAGQNQDAPKSDQIDPEAYRRRDRSSEPMFATINALMNGQKPVTDEIEYLEQDRD